MATADEYRAAARRALEGGDPAAAKRLIEAGRKAEKADRSGWQVFKDNLLGDDDPTTQNFGEKIGAALNKAGEAMTFGLIGDEASAGLESMMGADYDERLAHYRDQEEVLKRDNPGLAIGAEIGGGLAGALIPGIGTLGTVGRGASLGTRLAAGVGAGAGMGATYGFMEGEGADERALKLKEGLMTGAAAGAVAPLVGGAWRGFRDTRLARGAIDDALREGAESTSAMRGAAGRLQDEVAALDVRLNPNAVQRMSGDVRRRIAPSLDPYMGTTPGGYRAAGALDKVLDAHQVAPGLHREIPLDELRKVKHGMQVLGRDVNPIGKPTADARLGIVGADALDEGLSSLTPRDIASGNIDEAMAKIGEFNALWKKVLKTDLMDDVLENAENYLGGPTSAIRNKIGSILRNPKHRSRFNAAELEMLRRVVQGDSMATRLMRMAGNGLGRLGQVGLGAGLGDATGAIAGALTGEATREMADQASVRAAQIARDVIASGRLQNIPQSSDKVRRIIEALVMRGGAATQGG